MTRIQYADMRLHRSVKIGMVTAGLLALAVLGPVSFAVLSLRSTPESSGASAGAWITVGIVLVLVVAAAALAGGALVAFVRWLMRRRDSWRRSTGRVDPGILDS